MIRIGTSGYSYDDWVGPFYPANLKKSDWLEFYARHFDTTELNFSYYRQPEAGMLERMAAKVPPGFVFTIKAFQGLTHERAEDNAGEFQTFVEALAPLIDQDKFGCVLAQFPFSFHATPENVDYVKLCRERFGDLAVVIEFRNREWLTPAMFQLLREQRLGFCCVDEPQFKQPDAAHRRGDGAGGIRSISWAQRTQVVEARAGLRAVRLHLLGRGARRVGAQDRKARRRSPDHLCLCQQPLSGAGDHDCSPARYAAGTGGQVTRLVSANIESLACRRFTFDKENRLE